MKLKKNGLEDDHYWPAGKGPREHNKLSKEYDKICEETFIDTLREFDLNDLADLKAKKSQKNLIGYENMGVEFSIIRMLLLKYSERL